MKGRLLDFAFGRDGKQRVTVELDEDFREGWDALHDGEVAVEIKKYRKRRSLDANAYAWVLIDRLAEKLRMPKLDVYRELIRNIGGVSQTVCVQDKAVQDLISGWSHNGLGWFAETMPSKLSGCTNVILYYGSSSYDSAQMSALLDLLIDDCKAQGIETTTPEELAKYKEEWKQ